MVEQHWWPVFVSTPAGCTQLINSIGVFFQVLDNHRNFNSYADHKGFCDDLSESRFCSTIIQATAADPLNPFLLSILRQKSKDHSLKLRARDYMLRIGAFDRARQCIN